MPLEEIEELQIKGNKYIDDWSWSILYYLESSQLIFRK